jgi:hypothetical protein
MLSDEVISFAAVRILYQQKVNIKMQLRNLHFVLCLHFSLQVS